jgi:hypothetical protein
MEQGSESRLEQRLQAALEQMAADRIRLDALIARIDALEVPLDRREVQDELDRLDDHLQAITARVARLDATADPAATRPRGLIGALRAERPPSEEDAPPTD